MHSQHGKSFIHTIVNYQYIMHAHHRVDAWDSSAGRNRRLLTGGGDPTCFSPVSIQVIPIIVKNSWPIIDTNHSEVFIVND